MSYQQRNPRGSQRGGRGGDRGGGGGGRGGGERRGGGEGGGGRGYQTPGPNQGFGGHQRGSSSSDRGQRGGWSSPRGGGGDRRGQDRGVGQQSGDRPRHHSYDNPRPSTSSGYSRGGGDASAGQYRGSGRGGAPRGRGGRHRSASPVRTDVRRSAKRVDILDEFRDKRRGTVGKSVELIANHFPIKPIKPSDRIDIFHYDIDISVLEDKNRPKKRMAERRPTKENQNENKIIVDKLSEDWTLNGQRVLRPNTFGFDGNKNLYSIGDLMIGSDQVTQVITIGLDGRREQKFVIKIQLTRRIPINSFNNLMTAEDFAEAHPAFDIFLRHIRDRLQKPNLVTVGRNLFDLNDKTELPEQNCSIVVGHHKSVHQSECGLTLNVDRLTTVFRTVTEEPLIEFIRRELKLRNITGDLKQYRFDGRLVSDISPNLKGLKIFTTHIPSGKRKYTIDSLSTQTADQQKFKNDSGVDVSVSQYFKDQYKITLQYKTMPLIKIKGGREARYLPAEICTLYAQKMSREMITNNQSIQSEVVRSANSQTPLKRFEKNQNSLQTVIDESQELMTNAGYEIQTTPIKLDGRELPVPKFQYKSDNRKADDYVLFNTIPLKNSVFLNLSPKVVRDYDNYYQKFFLAQDMGMVDQARRIKFDVSPPIKWKNYGKNYDYDLGSNENKGKQIDAFKTFLKDFKQEINRVGSKLSSTQLVFVCLPYVNDIYNTVKHLSENVYGILTQCIDDKNYTYIPKGYFFNFLRKTNAKLNGQNQLLVNSYRPKILTSNKTMVVGADVTHSGIHNPLAEERVASSIAAVVASYDQDFTKYVATVSAQPPNVESIRYFDVVFGRLLKEYKRLNKCYPVNVVFFRDGVSESQLQTVMDNEVALIGKAYQTLNVGFVPKIKVFVVQKRHHTRLLMTQPEVNERTQKENFNPRPGTVVDNTITSANLDEFILYSQKGMLGTSRPAKYVELKDDLNLSADDWQKFAFSMCFTYHRCSTPISIPIPVRYADDVAYRGKRHLHAQHITFEQINPNETIEEKMAREERLLQDIDQKIKVMDNIVILPYYV